MQQITPMELKGMLDAGKELSLVDVRETWEHEEYNIGGLLLPFDEAMSRVDEIAVDKPVVVYCKKGVRSAIVIQRLEQKTGFTNLINLAGGIDAWKKLQATEI
jgi:adenylyltransferase/sulfurtransferase